MRVLLELREADGVRLKRKFGIHVLHEAVAEQPGVAAETEVPPGNGADAHRAFNLAEVEAEGERRSALASVTLRQK